MFSIVIPLYNKKNHIAECVNSVLCQSYANFEVIVIDDGSTDDGINQILAISDQRIRIFHQDNQGVSVARNNGIEKARFKYVAFLDADDIWDTSHLQTLYEMINKYPDLTLYSTSYFQKLNGVTTPIEHGLEKKETKDNIIVIDNFFDVLIKHQNIAWTSVLLVNLTKLPNGTLYRTGMRMGEDIDFLLRASVDGVLCFSLKQTAIYNLDADNRACKKYYRSDLYNTMLNEWFVDYEKDRSTRGVFVKQMQAAFMRNLISQGYGYYVRKILNRDKVRYFGYSRFLNLWILTLVPSFVFNYYRNIKQLIEARN